MLTKEVSETKLCIRNAISQFRCRIFRLIGVAIQQGRRQNRIGGFGWGGGGVCMKSGCIFIHLIGFYNINGFIWGLNP